MAATFVPTLPVTTSLRAALRAPAAPNLICCARMATMQSVIFLARPLEADTLALIPRDATIVETVVLLVSASSTTSIVAELFDELNVLEKGMVTHVLWAVANPVMMASGVALRAVAVLPALVVAKPNQASTFVRAMALILRTVPMMIYLTLRAIAMMFSMALPKMTVFGEAFVLFTDFNVTLFWFARSALTPIMIPIMMTLVLVPLGMALAFTATT